MKKILIVLSIILCTSFTFAETSLDKADSFYDQDNYVSAKPYYEDSLFNEGIKNGKIFYRLGYTYEQLKYQKPIYSKLYCAAAYCFERDKDKDNKYYSYALAKEKDLGVNHNSYNEETINKIIDELYWKNHKKDFSYFINHKKALLLCTIMAIFLLIIVISIIDNFIRHISRNNLKIKNIEFNFKDIFKTSNYVNSGTDFNNQLQNSYNNMVQCAREGCTKIANPENYLLYRFGQVIFTKNGNKVDYKTVTKGLNQVFFSEPLTVESSNLKINFLNKFNDFFHKWKELQKVTDNRLYEIPELGVLLSVLFSKMSLDNFIWNANIVIDLSNKFENINNKSYREAFLEIANKIYHEKGSDNELSKKLELELNSFDKKFSTKIKTINGNIRAKIIQLLPLLIFVYIMFSFYYFSSLSFGKTVLTGICCFIFYKFKNKIIDPSFKYKIFNNLITKAEQETNERKRQEQEKARQAAAESYSYSPSYQKPVKEDDYEEEQNYNKEQYYSNRKDKQSDYEPKQQSKVITKYIFQCRKCGKILKNTTTPQNSATCFDKNYHSWIKIAEEGDNIYECRKCGLTIGCKSTPQSTTTCIEQNYHSWTKIAEKGDNLYECRKCGKTLRCKSIPQNTTTCENRNYHSWHKI